MDWANESYVRLYTRDTTNWKRLGWPGRAILPLLLRKVDRAGALDLDGLEPWEAVALHVECPEDIARDGVAALLRVGTLEVRGGLLVFPNHIEAQTAAKSDKLRAKESREWRSLGGARKLVTQESREQESSHELSQIVTAPSRNETRESRESGPSHEPSHGVTLNYALPSNALLSKDQSAQARAQQPAATELDDSEPPPRDNLATKRTPEILRLAFERRFVAKTGNMPSWAPGAVRKLGTVAAWLDARPDTLEALERLLDGFFADKRAALSSYPIAFLENNPSQYLSPPRVRVASGRSAPGTTEDDFADAPPLEEQLKKFARKETSNG